MPSSRVSWSDPILVGSLNVSVDDILSRLGPMLTDERRARLDQVVSQRSLHFVSVLESIYDRGNVSAVMRSSEAFGFLQMSLVDLPGARFKAANRVTRGAEKWLDVKSFSNPKEAVADLKLRVIRFGRRIWKPTTLSTRSIGDVQPRLF